MRAHAAVLKLRWKVDNLDGDELDYRLSFREQNEAVWRPLGADALLKPEYEEVQLGTAEIREVFRSSRFGNIAGCIVRTGEIRRNSKARLMRNGVVIGDNLTIESLKRFKDDATEVREGFECGIGLGSFNDIKIEDVIETFEMQEKPRIEKSRS